MIFILVALMVVMFVLCIHEHLRARAWRVYAETVMRHKQEALAREQRGLEIIKTFTTGAEEIFVEIRHELEKVQTECDVAEAALEAAGFVRCVGPAGWRPPVNVAAAETMRQLLDVEQELKKTQDAMRDSQDALRAAVMRL